MLAAFILAAAATAYAVGTALDLVLCAWEEARWIRAHRRACDVESVNRH